MVRPASRYGPAPKGVGDDEWKIRCDLAACYQLFNRDGRSELSDTHISARVPDSNDILINPHGVLFDDITASSLIRVRDEGQFQGDSDYPFNSSGFLIHSCILRNRQDVVCVVHSRSDAGCAVAMQKAGLLPCSDSALILMGWLSYHDYAGKELDAQEQRRLFDSLGDRTLLVLRNDGLVSCGDSVGAAYIWMTRLEMACRKQIAGQAGDAPLNFPSEDAQRSAIERGLKILGQDGYVQPGREWHWYLNALERMKGTSYRT